MMKTYEASLKDKKDWKNAIDTAVEEGRKTEKMAIARQMKAEKIPIDSIARITGLSVKEIEKL